MFRAFMLAFQKNYCKSIKISGAPRSLVHFYITDCFTKVDKTSQTYGKTITIAMSASVWVWQQSHSGLDSEITNMLNNMFIIIISKRSLLQITLTLGAPYYRSPSTRNGQHYLNCIHYYMVTILSSMFEQKNVSRTF